jgi:hypothetical protein
VRRSNIFCKIEVSRSSEMVFSESHLPLSFGPFQIKLVHQLGMEHGNNADSKSVGNKDYITFQNVLIYLDTEIKLLKEIC